jgi:uncharacterized RDD family membrane protein YckC
MAVPAAAGPLSAYPPAGLDRRFYAFALDRLIAWAIYGLAAYLVWRFLLREGAVWAGVGVLVAVVLLVGLVFAVLVGVRGSTPGKSLMGLRVVRVGGGTPIGVGPALLRTLVLGVAALPTFGLGVATLAQTAVTDRGRQRRGWHDHLTDAVVVDVSPAVEQALSAVEAPRQVVNLTAMRLAPTPPPQSTPTPPRRQPPTQPTAPQVTLPPGAPPGRTPLPSGPPPGWQPPEPEAERTVVRGAGGAHAATPRAPGGWRVTFDTGESFVVEGLTLVGRRPEGRPGEAVRHLVPLPSQDMSVSKTHAQVAVAADGVLVVMDRGSTNGSVLVRSGVARELPAGRPTTLLTGDTVRFGDRSMSVARDA